MAKSKTESKTCPKCLLLAAVLKMSLQTIAELQEATADLMDAYKRPEAAVMRAQAIDTKEKLARMN